MLALLFLQLQRCQISASVPSINSLGQVPPAAWPPPDIPDVQSISSNLEKESEPLDEALYSRQLFVLGKDAMLKMGKADVLVTGLSGLGAEICKNVILAGVRSVTLHDERNSGIEDLSTQFCLQSDSIGKNRAAESIAHLRELNPYVEVRLLEGPLTEDALEGHSFDVVCCVDGSLGKQLSLNDLCRRKNSKFIATSVRGAFASAFCDLGDSFQVVDADGEEPRSSFVTCIKCVEGRIETPEGERHDFRPGDVVRIEGFGGVEGEWLDERELEVVGADGPTAFRVKDISGLGTGGEPAAGCRVVQVKKEVKLPPFLPLRRAMAPASILPLITPSDFAKMSDRRTLTVHACFASLDRYRRLHGGKLPTPGSSRDAAAFLDVVRTCPYFREQKKDKKDKKLEPDVHVVEAFARGAAGALCPLTAFYGGVVGQEIIKACSGRFLPLRQFLYYDTMEALPDPLPNRSDASPRGDRYDAERAVIGDTVLQALMRQRILMVGAGAIGCELLKNFALMGVGCMQKTENSIETHENIVHEADDDRGITVTDMDTIEKSNLNRQFLFRPKDVGSAKSEAAAAAARHMNPALVVTPLTKKVGAESEDYFDDEFWENLHVAVTALDNAEARVYVDERCVGRSVPLLESGTLGARGNAQVILPGLSESYGSSADPPTPSVPLCTLKHFPSEIAHTIHWARDTFDGFFELAPAKANKFLRAAREAAKAEQTSTDNKHVRRSSAIWESLASELRTAGMETAIATMRDAAADLGGAAPVNFQDCLVWAKQKFRELFRDSALELLEQHPPGSLDEHGDAFWTGARRPPEALLLDSRQATHREFIWWSAVLRARVYGLPVPLSLEDRHKAGGVAATVVDKNTEKHTSREQIDTSDSELVDSLDIERQEPNFEIEFSAARKAAEAWLRQGGGALLPLVFEKDDDSNGHVDFIAATSNLRAVAYGIPTADRLHTKRVAGNIVPAIATTTAAVAGLVCVELIKLVQGKPMSAHKNAFLNLAEPFFAFTEPVEAERYQWGRQGGEDKRYFTLWDRLVVPGAGEMTVRGLLKYLEREHGMSPASSTLSYKDSLLYASFLHDDDPSKLDVPIRELVQTAGLSDGSSWLERDSGVEKDAASTEHIEEEEEEHIISRIVSSADAVSPVKGRFLDLIFTAEDDAGEELQLPMLRLDLSESWQGSGVSDKGQSSSESLKTRIKHRLGQFFRKRT